MSKEDLHSSINTEMNSKCFLKASIIDDLVTNGAVMPIIRQDVSVPTPAKQA